MDETVLYKEVHEVLQSTYVGNLTIETSKTVNGMSFKKLYQLDHVARKLAEKAHEMYYPLTASLFEDMLTHFEIERLLGTSDPTHIEQIEEQILRDGKVLPETKDIVFYPDDSIYVAGGVIDPLKKGRQTSGNSDSKENSTMNDTIDEYWAEEDNDLDTTLNTLREMAGRPRVKDRTVIEMTMTNSRTGYQYVYVALYIAATRKWYLTGDGNYWGKNVFTDEEMTEIISTTGAGNIRVATKWERL